MAKWVQPELTWWDKAELWAQSDEVRLAVALTTYYMICALVGFWQGLALGEMITGQYSGSYWAGLSAVTIVCYLFRGRRNG